jgi:hypothetical protein
VLNGWLAFLTRRILSRFIVFTLLLCCYDG